MYKQEDVERFENDFLHDDESRFAAYDILKDVLAHPYNPQAEREKMLEALKKDLQTRFISSGNQWSRGRNSGLNECYNIIDELFHQIKDGEQG
jgi:hypothetical protein